MCSRRVSRLEGVGVNAFHLIFLFLDGAEYASIRRAIERYERDQQQERMDGRQRQQYADTVNQRVRSHFGYPRGKAEELQALINQAGVDPVDRPPLDHLLAAAHSTSDQPLQDANYTSHLSWPTLLGLMARPRALLALSQSCRMFRNYIGGNRFADSYAGLKVAVIRQQLQEGVIPADLGLLIQQCYNLGVRDFSGLALAGPFYNLDVPGANFSGCAVRQASGDAAASAPAPLVFRACNFNDTIFNDSWLAGATFDLSRINRMSLRGAELRRLEIRQSEVSPATMDLRGTAVEGFEGFLVCLCSRKSHTFWELLRERLMPADAFELPGEVRDSVNNLQQEVLRQVEARTLANNGSVGRDAQGFFTVLDEENIIDQYHQVARQLVQGEMRAPAIFWASNIVMQLQERGFFR